MRNLIKNFNSGVIAGDEDELLQPRPMRISAFIGTLLGALAIIALVGLASLGIWWPIIWGAVIRAFITLYRQWLLSEPFKSDEEIHQSSCNCGCTENLDSINNPDPPPE